MSGSESSGSIEGYNLAMDPIEEYRQQIEFEIGTSVAKLHGVELDPVTIPSVKCRIAEAIVNSLHIDDKEASSELVDAIAPPPKREDIKWQPDYGIPMFMFSKDLKLPPHVIAQEAAQSLSKGGQIFEHVDNSGPYLNVRISDELVADNLNTLLARGETALRHASAAEVVLVDYSSPNVAKPFGVNHLRSTVIGESISRILEAAGKTVIRDNHLGDWGTQFGNLIAAYEVFAPEADFTSLSTDELNKLYVRFSSEKSDKPELVIKGRENFKKLSERDPELLSKWFHVIKKSREEFSSIYSRMGINFDTQIGEAYFGDLANELVDRLAESPPEELAKSDIVIGEDGSAYIDGEHPVVLRTKDGYCVYAARDLATIIFRSSTYNPKNILYVVGEEQSTSFNSVFKTAQVLGLNKTQEGQASLEHASFGLFLDAEGKKLSTRKGTSGKLADLIDELDGIAFNEIKSRNPNMSDEEALSNAQILSMGAIIWNDLKTDRKRNIKFDARQALSLGAGTVVDVLYSYVRTTKILERAGYENETIQLNPSQLSLATDYEHALGVKLIELNDVIAKAAKERMPSYLVQYLNDLSQLHGRFYESSPVLNESNTNIRNMRIALHKAYEVVMKEGLDLLNIKVPSRL